MSSRTSAVLIGIVTALIGVAASMLPWTFELEENLGLKLLFTMRGSRRPPDNVMVVAIDKVSATRLELPNKPEKWPRTLHARLIDRLRQKGAAVIAFDIFFQEKHNPREDQLLAKSLSQAQNVIIGALIEADQVLLTNTSGKPAGNLNIERVLHPIASLRQAALLAAPFPLPKVPVRVNQYWLFKPSAGDIATFPMVAFQAYALEVYNDFKMLFERHYPQKARMLPTSAAEILSDRKIETLLLSLRTFFKSHPGATNRLLTSLQHPEPFNLSADRLMLLRNLIQAYQNGDSCYLNFYGPAGTIPTVSYVNLLQALEHEDRINAPIDLAGIVFFVGLSESRRVQQQDDYHTVFSQRNGIDISGVEIAASAFANLYENFPVRPLNPTLKLVTVLVWGVLVSTACCLLPSVAAACTTILLAGLYLGLAFYQFQHAAIWLPLVVPFLFQVPLISFSAIFCKYKRANRERQTIRKAFGYYLPNKVVDQLAINIANIHSSNQLVYGICLFTDAEQYTTLSESLDPKALGTFMNRYFDTLFRPIRKHHGSVADVVGDAMLAIWAAPNPDIKLKTSACSAALEISQAVENFNDQGGRFRLPTRIGIHAGHILLGNMGAVDHYEYRPVGDIVNTSSRIEGLNKYLKTNILTSTEVLKHVEGFATRRLGSFILAGKSEPVEVHELICQKEKFTPQSKNLCTIFEEGLDAFQHQHFTKADAAFKDILKNSPNDGPSKYYVDKCHTYGQIGVKEDWKGAIKLSHK